MKYQPQTASQLAGQWGLSSATVRRWRRRGVIPEDYAVFRPLTANELRIQQRVLHLMHVGWINGMALSRDMGRANKMNRLKVWSVWNFRRSATIGKLTNFEIAGMETRLDELRAKLARVLSLTNHNEKQIALRDLLALPWLSKRLLRTDLDKAGQARLQGFINGRKCTRTDLAQRVNVLTDLHYHLTTTDYD